MRTRQGLFALYLCTAPLLYLAPAHAEVFLGQHVFYTGDWASIKQGDFDGVRIWSGSTQSVTWKDIEPASGSFDFSRLDQHVASARARHMDVIYTLGQTPIWASARPAEMGNMGLGAAAEPNDMALWTRYVTAVVSRYKGKVSAYEILNEPRIPEAIKPYSPGFFSGSTEKLIEMTQLARTAVKSVDPAATIVCSPMDGGDLGVKRLDYILGKGAGQHCDVIGFHFYLKTETVAEFNDLLAQIRQVLAKYKLSALPIWNTEIGVLVKQSGNNVVPRAPSGALSTVHDERDAAAFMTKIVLASEVGGIARTYWFAHDSSSMGSTLPNKTAGGLNGLGIAYTQVKTWFSGKSPAPCNPSDAHADCSLRAGGKTVARVSWGKPWTVAALQDAGVKATWTLAGQRSNVADLTDATLAALTRNFADPVYLALQ